MYQGEKLEVEEESLARNGQDWRAEQLDLTLDMFMSADTDKEYLKTRMRLERMINSSEWMETSLCSSETPTGLHSFFDKSQAYGIQDICKAHVSENRLIEIDKPFYSYLLGHFWSSYEPLNPVIRKLHSGKALGERIGCNCLIFLILCILAMGSHYAGISRCSRFPNEGDTAPGF